MAIEVNKAHHVVTALIDDGSELNLISQRCVKELNLPPSPISSYLGLKTINGQPMQAYGVHYLTIEVVDTLGRTRYFQEGFMATDTGSEDMVLGMPFLQCANPDIDHSQGTFNWRVYDAQTALHTVQRIEVVEPKIWVKDVLRGADAYLMHVTAIDDQPPTDKPLDIPSEYADYADVFSEDNANILPDHGPHDHAIDLINKEKQPPYGPIYNLSETELATLRAYIDTHLETGFIKPSKSPAGAPILFTKKPNGGLRLCVDYRGLNNLTIKNRYPLPLVGESLDRLGRARKFTKIDLTNAYYRIRIKQGDEWKTAFRTRYGHFEYQVLPFGLANAPATFQAYINAALAEKLDIFVIVYLDDILIYSENPKDHVDHVKWVLDRLRKHSLFANLKKCSFHTNEVRFLGYIVSADGVRMEESRIESVQNWPEPTSVREIQVFIGFANFYRRFIKEFSRIAAPLTTLVKDPSNAKKKNRLTPLGGILTPEAREAFNILKDAFLTAPVLVHFDSSKPIRVETDASGWAISAILTQLDKDSHWHPVAYFSRKMSPPERNYETHDGEMLAIVEAFKQWRHYLEGAHHQILVLTDHHNLKKFMETKRLSGRQIRWAQELSRYNFLIDYRAGRKNPADGPSRRLDYLDNEEAIEADRLILREFQRKLQGATRLSDGRDDTQHPTSQSSDGANGLLDSHLNGVWAGANSKQLERKVLIAGTGAVPPLIVQWSRIRSALSASTRDKQAMLIREELPELLANDKYAADVRKNLETPEVNSLSGLVGNPWTIAEDRVLLYDGRLYVPPSLHISLIQRYHDNPLAGHFGVEKTLDLLRRYYYWPDPTKAAKNDPINPSPPGMRASVEDYIQACTICKRSKAPRHKPHGRLTPLPIPTHKWKDLSMDFVTGLPPSRDWNGQVYDSICVVLDRLTKMAHYIAVTTTLTAWQLAHVIHQEIVRIHGLPDSIVSDRDKLFTSHFHQELCQLLRIKPRLSTAYHPQTDGQTERQNSTMEQYLRAYVNYEQDDWVLLLASAEFAYNNATQSSTKVSPFYAMYGYNPRMSFEDEPDRRSISQPAEDHAQHLQQVMRAMKDELTRSQASQQKFYDKHSKDTSFEVGEKVWLNRRNIRTKRPSSKLDWKMIGPFKIIKKHGKNAYKLDLPPSYRIHDVFHVSLLERDPTQGESPLDVGVDEDNTREYMVEAIRDSRVFKPGEFGNPDHPGGLFYLVHWKGEPDTEDT